MDLCARISDGYLLLYSSRQRAKTKMEPIKTPDNLPKLINLIAKVIFVIWKVSKKHQKKKENLRKFGTEQSTGGNMVKREDTVDKGDIVTFIAQLLQKLVAFRQVAEIWLEKFQFSSLYSFFFISTGQTQWPDAWQWEGGALDGRLQRWGFHVTKQKVNYNK